MSGILGKFQTKLICRYIGQKIQLENTGSTHVTAVLKKINKKNKKIPRYEIRDGFKKYDHPEFRNELSDSFASKPRQLQSDWRFLKREETNGI
ncbi:hypothetical protein PGB90_001460 [Kerria lacca]